MTCLIKSKPFSCTFKLVNMHFYSFNEQDVKWCHWYLGIIYLLDLFSLSYKISFSIIFLFSDIFKSSNDLCKIYVFLSSYGNWIFSKCKWVALNLHIYIISILLFFTICFLCNQSKTEAACTCLWSLYTFHSKKK